METVEPMVCGCGEMFGDGTPALKLSTNRPLCIVRDSLPDHNQDTIWSWVDKASRRWGQVCDWSMRRISQQSEAGPNDIICLVTVDDLGGSGVLADMMLPYTGGKILRMRINNRIRWRETDGSMQGGYIDPIRTICHELGHFQGHSHWPTGSPSELMEPSIQQAIIGPQPTESRVSAAWFGNPQPPVPPIPPQPGLYRYIAESTAPITFKVAT